MIKTSEYGKQTVNPKGFWIMVGFVLAGFAAWGTYFMATGKFPLMGLGLGRISSLIFLNLCWAANVYFIARKGWRAAPWNHWVLQIGFSLFYLGKYVYPDSVLSAAWIQGPAMLGIGVGSLAPYVIISRKNRLAAAEANR